jgi:hypothetical protein
MNITKEEALEKLNNYFEYKTSSLLEILDTPSNEAKKRGGYTGVSAGYLMEYVVPEIDVSLFLECINDLIREKIVAKIKCINIGRVVFEKYKSDYEHYRNYEEDQIITHNDIIKSELYITNDKE